jgi:hypothetical protein
MPVSCLSVIRWSRHPTAFRADRRKRAGRARIAALSGVLLGRCEFEALAKLCTWNECRIDGAW